MACISMYTYIHIYIYTQIHICNVSVCSHKCKYTQSSANDEKISTQTPEQLQSIATFRSFFGRLSGYPGLANLRLSQGIYRNLPTKTCSTTKKALYDVRSIPTSRGLWKVSTAWLMLVEAGARAGAPMRRSSRQMAHSGLSSHGVLT